MCSHMPPPPPNRLVRVSLPASLPITSVYQPVVIVGTLHAGRHDTSMYLIDGQVRMLSAWTLETREVAAVDRQTGFATETPWQRRLRSAIGADRDRPASVPAVAAGRPGGAAGSAPDMASQSGTSAGQ